MLYKTPPQYIGQKTKNETPMNSKVHRRLCFHAKIFYTIGLSCVVVPPQPGRLRRLSSSDSPPLMNVACCAVSFSASLNRTHKSVNFLIAKYFNG